MLPSHGPERSAIALQFAAALQGYAEDVARLVDHGFHSDLYQRVSARMDEMQRYAASLPALSGAWAEMLIHHFELTGALFRAGAGEAERDRLRELHTSVQESVQRLSARCLRMLSGA